MLTNLTERQGNEVVEVLSETWRVLDKDSRDLEYSWAREAAEVSNFPVSTHFALQAWISLANAAEGVLRDSAFHLLSAYTFRDYLAELLNLAAFSETPLGYLVRKTDQRFYEYSVELSHPLFGFRAREGDLSRPWYWHVPKRIDKYVHDELLDHARLHDDDVDTVRALLAK